MKNQRQNEILDMLSENHALSASELSQKFHVSMETIRRDLEYLEKKGHLTRTHGGAVSRSMLGTEPEYLQRQSENSKSKDAIGKAAASLVEDGDTLIIDSGTTTLAFTKYLAGFRRLTIFTNSLPVASELMKYPDLKIIILGGVLRTGELSTSGFVAEDNLRLFHADKAFLGAGGLSLAHGMGDYHMEESNLKRLCVQHAQKVIVLADHSKLGQIALNHTFPLKDIDVLITDPLADAKFLSELRRRDIRVISAK